MPDLRNEADPQSNLRSLSLKDVSKRYEVARKPPVEALSPLTFDVPAGQFVSIVGPSGCGKTTLLKIIAGLIPPTNGTVRVGQEAVSGPIRDFGMVFQAPNLLPWRNVVDNVLLPIEMLGLRPRDYAGRARGLLQEVGIGGFEDRRPKELSGGMQKRVALCRALIHDPGFLLMDEPFAAVDELTREGLNDQLLAVWAARRKTIVFVTHNVAEAAYLSDRVVVLSRRPGRIVGIVDISLPRPRKAEMRYAEEMTRHARAIQGWLRNDA